MKITAAALLALWAIAGQADALSATLSPGGAWTVGGSGTLTIQWVDGTDIQPGASFNIDLLSGTSTSVVASSTAPAVAGSQTISVSIPSGVGASSATVSLCVSGTCFVSTSVTIIGGAASSTTSAAPATTTGAASTSSVASSAASSSSVAPASSSTDSGAVPSTTGAAITTGPPNVATTSSLGTSRTGLTSGTATSTAVSGNDPSNGTGPNLAVLIGGIGGGVVALALIVALGCQFYLRQKYNAKNKRSHSDVLPPPSNAWKPVEESQSSYPMVQMNTVPKSNDGYYGSGPAQNGFNGGAAVTPSSHSYGNNNYYQSNASNVPGYQPSVQPPLGQTNMYNDKDLARDFADQQLGPNVKDSPKRYSSLARANPMANKEVMFVRVARNKSNEDELDLAVGERLTVLERFPDGWGMVQNERGECGVAPINFLESRAEEPPQPPQKTTRTVSCARIATQADELGISVGEEITVIEVYDDGWGLAMNGHGEQGMIPMNFLA